MIKKYGRRIGAAGTATLSWQILKQSSCMSGSVRSLMGIFTRAAPGAHIQPGRIATVNRIDLSGRSPRSISQLRTGIISPGYR